jgi:hypothetical protein
MLIGLWEVEAPTLSRQLAHRRRWGCQIYALAALYPQDDSWYSFLLQAKSTPGRGRLEGLRQLKKSNDLTGNGTHDLPACSIAYQPTTLPRIKEPYFTNVYFGLLGRWKKMYTWQRKSLLRSKTSNLRKNAFIQWICDEIRAKIYTYSVLLICQKPQNKHET